MPIDKIMESNYDDLFEKHPKELCEKKLICNKFFDLPKLVIEKDFY